MKSTDQVLINILEKLQNFFLIVSEKARKIVHGKKGNYFQQAQLVTNIGWILNKIKEIFDTKLGARISNPQLFFKTSLKNQSKKEL